VTRDAEWVEVKNGLTYSGLLLIAPQGTPLLDFNVTWVRPLLDENIAKDAKGDMLLRIVMVGEIMENDIQTGKLVGTYVDVYLSP
jgi:hypothetical protein